MKTKIQTSVTKKTTLLAILLFVTGAACARWQEVGSDKDGNTYFIHQDTILKDGNLRRVWEVREFKQQTKKGEISSRARSEYDCKELRSRFLTLTTHPERLAGGTPIYSYDGIPQEGWGEIPPGSALAEILRIVCAK